MGFAFRTPFPGKIKRTSFAFWLERLLQQACVRICSLDTGSLVLARNLVPEFRDGETHCEELMLMLCCKIEQLTTASLFVEATATDALVGAFQRMAGPVPSVSKERVGCAGTTVLFVHLNFKRIQYYVPAWYYSTPHAECV